MKKIAILTIVSILTIGSLTAYACPRGEHPYGGTGPHHKGGYCA